MHKIYLKFKIFICYSFNVETNGGNSCHNFTGLQSMQIVNKYKLYNFKLKYFSPLVLKRHSCDEIAVKSFWNWSILL